jgi:hypothetical protein
MPRRDIPAGDVPARGLPSNVMSPVTSISPLIARSVVVLPAPLAPALLDGHVEAVQDLHRPVAAADAGEFEQAHVGAPR